MMEGRGRAYLRQGSGPRLVEKLLSLNRGDHTVFGSPSTRHRPIAAWRTFRGGGGTRRRRPARPVALGKDTGCSLPLAARRPCPALGPHAMWVSGPSDRGAAPRLRTSGPAQGRTALPSPSRLTSGERDFSEERGTRVAKALAWFGLQPRHVPAARPWARVLRGDR